jgi:hypothetical protein
LNPLDSFAFFARSAWGERIIGWSSLSVCQHDSIREPLDGLGWNLVWVLCHSGLLQNRTFEYPTIGDNKITAEESREVDRQ